MVAGDGILAAKGKFDGVIERAADGVILNDVAIAARRTMRLDKNSVAVSFDNRIVTHNILARTRLQHDATRVAARTHRAVTPRAVAQIVRRAVSRHLAELHIV